MNCKLSGILNTQKIGRVGKKTSKRVVKQTVIDIDRVSGVVKPIEQVNLVRTNQRLMLKIQSTPPAANSNPIEVRVNSRHPAVSVKNNSIVCKNGDCVVLDNLRFSGSSGRGKRIDLEIVIRDVITGQESLVEFRQAIKVTRDGERKRIRKFQSDDDATTRSSSSSASSSSSSSPSPSSPPSAALLSIEQNFKDFSFLLDQYHLLFGSQMYGFYLSQEVLDGIRGRFYTCLLNSQF